MAEAKKTTADKEKEAKKKSTATKKSASTSKAKTTATKKATTSKPKTTDSDKKDKKVQTTTINLTIDRPKRKKATELEKRAQEARKRLAKAKSETERKEIMAELAKLEAEVKAEAEAKAKAELEKLAKVASETKAKSEKIKSSKSKLESMKAKNVKVDAKNKKEESKLTKVVILDFDNKKLPKELFASSKIYEQAIFDTIISERASLRQGTHDVKNRAEVSGTGKKPWRQKGTGRARTGSLRTPVFVGGGRAFGPTPERNYKLKVNKKVKKAAFVSALTLLAQNKAVIIDDLKLDKVSTKEAVKKLTSLKINDLKHILIVSSDETVAKSVNNLQNVICVHPFSVTVEVLIWADALVLSNEGLKVFEGKVK
ncbi:50S ribosomal protein L4 [Mycoplasma sp. Mirounga ES2805-ORL]|uniref:50S ribosomal protein L4 n=1 Tax=Mycoplasma sp. Mirounga ES2805-ORL TaxID=754514 RepID=UPI00197BBD99|nr:50S ribosomal protein L4 [Mycoplasma sp. Mirounga ES2805-ORL]QSF13962.1 50S ribosomal protein L4 [Mycoplasma sp. Mirounga ES2805-ORL]